MSTELANDNTLTTPMAKLTGFLGGANTRVVMIPTPYAEPLSDAVSGDAGYLEPVVTASTGDHDGLGLELAMDNNGSGNLGGGNGANTLQVTFDYRVIKIV
jgi:hypothetical protein